MTQKDWGSIDNLKKLDRTHIDLIVLDIDKETNSQFHYHRHEHLILIEGAIQVTIEGVEYDLKEGDCIDIKPGQSYKIINIGKIVSRIIAVQTGSYLEDDDIYTTKT